MTKNIKFIQINIFKGKYLHELINFLKEENADIIAMQEVTTGEMNNFEDKSANLFELLSNELGMFGVFHGDSKLKNFEGSTQGNAVFSKFRIIDHKIITLKTFREVDKKDLDDKYSKGIFPLFARHLLDAQLEIGDRKIHAMSWHAAWTAPPQDTKETLRQAQKVADYLKTLKDPYILGTDLNSLIQNKTVGLINEVSKNLMLNSGVLQTTHPTFHKIAPRGYLIDYIFTSFHFALKSLEVAQVTVSDHLPVIAELELSLQSLNN